jgi:hypothetical protein
MTHCTAADYAAGITLAEDFREAIRVRRCRRALQSVALILGAFLMFSAGILFERLTG